MARKKSAAKKAREAAAAATAAAATATTTNSTENAKDIKFEKPSLQKLPQNKKTLSPSKESDLDSDESLSSSSSSSSEEEDEYGDLITEDVETGINQVLQTIKTDPSKLLDPNVKFFEDPELIEYNETTKKHKPLYITDYNRMQLLEKAKGGKHHEDEEGENGSVPFDDQKTIDGQKSFVTVQKEEKDQLLAEIKKAFDEDVEDDSDSDSDEKEQAENNDDDDFFRKKEGKRSKNEEDKEEIAVGGSGSNLPDPNQDQQGFLNAFLDLKAWIPKKGDKIINLDKIDQTDEEEFDDAVEKFENAYNFRYEDPNGGAEIISYARNQATLRRLKTNLRKRQREKRQELKRQEDEIVQDLLKKKKTATVNKVMDRLSKIKQAIGGDNINVDDKTIERVFGDSLLNDDFDDADWDNKMAEIFNEQYYEAELEKPTWDDDDDDDDEIMGGDINSDEEDEEEQEEEEEEKEEDNASEEPPHKKSRKDLLKAKKSAKKEKQSLKEKAQAIVEANTLKLMDEIEEERGRQRENEHGKEIKFKYREVSPETFGLTTRDIILADDKQLNNFISIKKFAPYRPKELRLKDKRKYTKKKHLQEWKKETFKNLKLPKEIEQNGNDDNSNEIWIPNEDGFDTNYSNKGKNDKKKHNKSKSKTKTKKHDDKLENKNDLKISSK